MKTWVWGVAVLAICAGGVAMSVAFGTGESGVDTSIENVAGNAASNRGDRVALDATDRAPASGLDQAIEQRQAKLFICTDADAETVARLAGDMSQAGRNYAAVARKAG